MYHIVYKRDKNHENVTCSSRYFASLLYFIFNFQKKVYKHLTINNTEQIGIFRVN